MKKKALATKMAAFVMAGAMTMAMGGVTAFAAQVPFTKKVVDSNSTKDENGKAQNVYKPNTVFKFNLDAGNAGTIDDGSDPSKKVPVTAGVKENGVLVGITYNDTLTMTAEEGDKVAPGSISLDYDQFYDARVVPGIYHYILSEKDPKTAGIEGYTEYDGMTYSDETYDIYVFLNEKEKKAENTILVSKGGTHIYDGKTKTGAIDFTNTYTTYNLGVKKLVEGNQGDKSKDFTFTIKVDGAAGEKYKYIVYTIADNGDETATDQTGVIDSQAIAKTVYLKANQVVRVYGLSANDQYTVNENDYSTDGYKTEVTIGNSKTETREVKEQKLAADGTIVYTNTKNVTTPTGIVTEYAPYILLVAAAGAFAVLFLRRKKEEF